MIHQTNQPTEANPFHTAADCDETCHGCQYCYLATGDPMVCGRLCQHWRDNSQRDDERFEDERAARPIRGGEICLCAGCRVMLVEGDELVDRKVWDSDGELDYIELAHRACKPEW